jgi:hypothetical protein
MRGLIQAACSRSPPTDSRAMYRAIATAWDNVLESEEFMLAVDQRTLN